MLFETAGDPTISAGACNIVAASADGIRGSLAQKLWTPVQGWVAAYVIPTWADSAVPPNTTPSIWFWGDAAFDHRIYLANSANGDWTVYARATTAVAPSTYAAGEGHVVIGAWSAAMTKISVKGAAFVISATNNLSDTIWTDKFEVGCHLAFPAASRQLEGDMVWLMGGRGVLSDADAATLHSLAGADPAWSTLPDAALTTMLWLGNDFEYETRGAGLRPDVSQYPKQNMRVSA